MDFLNFDGIITGFVLCIASVVCMLVVLVSALVFFFSKTKSALNWRLFMNFSILLFVFLIQLPLFLILEQFPETLKKILPLADKLAFPFVLIAFFVTFFLTFVKMKNHTK